MKISDVHVMGCLKIINWNIGGAKYLELKSENDPERNDEEEPRELFRKRLNEALCSLIEEHKPSVVTLQEVVKYQDGGHSEQIVIDCPEGYHFLPIWLIDTERFAHTGKWDKIRGKAGWTERASFAQGNAILLKETVPHFPVWSLPTLEIGIIKNHHDWLKVLTRKRKHETPRASSYELVTLESGLYFGDRNTEPRAAMVTHLVLDELEMTRGRHVFKQTLSKPLDIFIINLHLTTLMMEREGIPSIDDEASKTRMNQLDIILNGIISRYNRWKKDRYPVRGKPVKPKKGVETHKRHKPIWVITGDFNFTPESDEYKSIIARGFIDLIGDHKLGTKTSGLGYAPTLTLDYAFVGPKFESVDPKVAEEVIVSNRVKYSKGVAVSDHYPLIVDVPISLINQ